MWKKPSSVWGILHYWYLKSFINTKLHNQNTQALLTLKTMLDCDEISEKTTYFRLLTKAWKINNVSTLEFGLNMFLDVGQTNLLLRFPSKCSYFYLTILIIEFRLGTHLKIKFSLYALYTKNVIIHNLC